MKSGYFLAQEISFYCSFSNTLMSVGGKGLEKNKDQHSTELPLPHMSHPAENVLHNQGCALYFIWFCSFDISLFRRP